MKYLLLFSVFLVLNLGYACVDFGGSDSRFLLLNPDVFGPKSARSVYYSFNHYLVDPKSYLDDDEYKLSVEWKNELHLKSSISAIQSYFFGGLSKKALKENPLYAEIDSHKKLKQFLLFAKSCEEVVNYSPLWDEKEYIKKMKLLPKLVVKGSAYLKNEKKSFWKKKYAFQVLRLAFYAEDFSLFYKIYNTYFQPEKNKKVIDWWGMHYYSMVLEKQEKMDSANYLHAQVWSNSTNKLTISREYYTPKNFENQLALAQNETEKVNLAYMRQCTQFDVDLSDLSQLVLSHPNHPRLGLVLSRELNKLEHKFAQQGDLIHYYSSSGYDYYSDEYEQTMEQTKVKFELVSFFNLLNELQKKESALKHLDLLQIQTALLTKNYTIAERLLKKCTVDSKTVAFQKEVLSLSLVLMKDCLKDEITQEEVGNRLSRLVMQRKGVFYADEIFFSLFALLENRADADDMQHFSGMAYFYYNNEFSEYKWVGNQSMIYQLQKYFIAKNSIRGAEKWLAVYRKKDKNALERFFFAHVINDFHIKDCLARLYYRNGKTQQAFRMANQVPDFIEVNAPVIVNPFTHELPNDRSIESIHYYTLKEIFGKILQLESKKNRSVAEEMDLAYVYFNSTSVGRAWMLKAYYCSNYWPEDKVLPDDAYFLEKAQNVFRAVLKRKINRELEARVQYMLAYIEAFSGTEESYAKTAELYETYRETAFYKEANCSWTQKKKAFVFVYN